jgi:hypothetical protein
MRLLNNYYVSNNTNYNKPGKICRTEKRTSQSIDKRDRKDYVNGRRKGKNFDLLRFKRELGKCWDVRSGYEIGIEK